MTMIEQGVDADGIPWDVEILTSIWLEVFDSPDRTHSINLAFEPEHARELATALLNAANEHERQRGVWPIPALKVTATRLEPISMQTFYEGMHDK